MKRIVAAIALISVIFIAGCENSKENAISSTFDNAVTEEKNTVNTENKTTEEDIPSKMELQKLGDLSFYLYTPKNPTENMPLIIYLHASPNKDADVTSLLTSDSFPKYLYEGYYGDLRAFVAVPKLEKNYKKWLDVSDKIENLIEHLNINCGIDLEKIALTGHSMGGSGTFQMQEKMPDTFACIAPLSGNVKNNGSVISALSKTKIWAFVGTGDTVVKPQSTKTVISVLKEKGIDATVTELDGAKHLEVPALAYKNPDFINWLVNCGK